MSGKDSVAHDFRPVRTRWDASTRAGMLFTRFQTAPPGEVSTVPLLALMLAWPNTEAPQKKEAMEYY
ncbi:MAG: hypothetical protein HY748_01145 [Elusimicrobia bacterium]|nr:hypothetical protein [Elusimicrobiota bacterium]